jgi:cytochrome c biogenesis protein CcmG/thiol:disulfide interchange protein DsbE
VVINKWASWCEPCRAESGVFQRASVSMGREVAFIGLDSGDPSRADALGFLRTFPLSYPSYYDHSGQLGAAITDSSFTPVTVFYNRTGGHYISQGPYLSVAKLERDIRRYALGA